MQYAYLDSFLEKLSSILATIFNTVFAPVLLDVLKIFINFATNVIWTLLADLFLTMFVALCSLIDFIESIFNLFAGIDPVLVTETDETMSILDALFQMEAISFAFMWITLIAIALCFIFTAYKTAKSISDMALENRNPVSKVLTDCMKACITFMLIPFLCLMMLQLSTAVTKQAEAAFRAGSGSGGTIGSIIFVSATMDADVQTMEERDISSGVIREKSTPRNPLPSLQDSIRSDYLDGTKDYRDLDQVRKDFHAGNISYVSGFASVIFMLFVLLISIITFIRRAFELLVLYVVSPLFVSTIPLDDGVTFAKWREMFVAKFFSGFGIVFAMKFYLLLVPLISNSKLELYDKSLPNGIIINNVLQIFFIIGGAWAVFKAQSLMMQILNPEAAQAEMQASAMTTGMIIGAASTAAAVATGGASAAAGLAGGALSSGVGGGVSNENSGGGLGGSGVGSKNDDSGQAYRG